MNAIPRIDVDLASRAQLIAHIDTIEARLAALAGAFAESRVAGTAQAFGLTDLPVRLLLILADGKPHTRAALYDGIYFDLPDDGPDPKIVDIFICRIRKSFAGTGIVVTTIWGLGYQVTAGLPELVKAINTGAVDRSSFARSPQPAPPRGRQPKRRISDVALAYLERRANRDGLVKISSRQIGRDLDMSYSGSSVITNLEITGKVEVIVRPSRGGRASAGRDWTLRLLERSA